MYELLKQISILSYNERINYIQSKKTWKEKRSEDTFVDMMYNFGRLLAFREVKLSIIGENHVFKHNA